MNIHKLNVTITAVLASLAVVLWARSLWELWPLWGVTVSGYRSAVHSLAVIITMCACLGWLLLNVSSIRKDRETRCRKCAYILRGLTEPRCPECGEKI